MKKEQPLKVQVIEKRKLTPEQISQRKRTTITNIADKVFNQGSSN